MSKEHDIFDDFLKRKFDSKQFEFEEAYWSKAKEMIDNSRKKRRRQLFTVIMPAFVFVATSIGVLMTSPSYQTTESIPSSISVTTPSQNSEIVPQSTISSQKQYTSTKAFAMADKDKQHTSSFNNNGNKKENTSITYSETTTTTSVVKNIPTSFSSKKHTPKTLGQEKNNTSFDQDLTATVKEKESSLPQNNYQITAQTWIAGRSSLPLSLNSIEGDSLSKKDLYLRATEQLSQRRFLTVEGGLNAYNMNGSSGDPLNFHTGIRYYYYVHPKIALSAGLTYSRLHQNLEERTYKNISYDFGEVVHSTSIKTTRLDYVDLPLSVHYDLYKKHHISAGATASYLIQSTELVTKQSETFTQERDNGHKQAFQPYDVQLNLGYLVFLPKGFNLSVTYNYGLIDISKNDIYKSSTINRNSGLRFTLGYKLF